MKGRPDRGGTSRERESGGTAEEQLREHNVARGTAAAREARKKMVRCYDNAYEMTSGKRKGGRLGRALNCIFGVLD